MSAKYIFITLITITTIGSVGFSDETNKFQRPSTSQSGDASGDGSSNKKKDAAKKPGDKLDVSDLENRYWTAKDNEFTVVQNRLYTKAKRFSVTPTLGSIVTDTYTTSYNYGLAVDYYMSEREGFELQLWKSSGSPSEYVSRLSQSNGISPDFNLHQGYIGASYVYVPIYAKMSWLDKKILYFDMFVEPGIGVTMLQSFEFTSNPLIAAPNANNQAAPTLSLDIGQQVFLSEMIAIRLDIRNHFYQETIYKANSGISDHSKFTYEGAIMLGVSIFR